MVVREHGMKARRQTIMATEREGRGKSGNFGSWWLTGGGKGALARKKRDAKEGELAGVAVDMVRT